MATLTVYPSPGTTVDGSVYASIAPNTWSTLRNNSGTGADSITSTTMELYIGADGAGPSTWGLLRRIVTLFDTSALTSGATISAAIMSVYGTFKSDSLAATPNIDVYTSNPSSNTSLAGGDYSTMGIVSQTGVPITYAGWSTTGYNDFTFNATGRGNISKTGISKFGLRNASYDVADVAPPWVSSGTGRMQMAASDAVGTSTDPKLVITYITGPATIKTFNGIAQASVKTVNGVATGSVKSWGTAT